MGLPRSASALAAAGTEGVTVDPRPSVRGVLGRTGRALGLALAAAALTVPLPGAAALELPPQEAFSEYPPFEAWSVVGAEVGRGGETAQIRLRHPDNPRVAAVLTYRLIGAVVKETHRTSAR